MTYQKFSQRSTDVIAYILGYEDTHGIPPAGEDIARGCGISHAYTYDLLRKMEEQGLIERPRINGRIVGRNLRLTKAAMKAIEEGM